jgi:hypothetical protein
MKLFLNLHHSLKEVASMIGKIALPDYRLQQREGLNLGGGDYFNFTKEGSTVLLVCNDDRHAEVYIESQKAFPYYLYVYKGANDVLEKAHAALSMSGVEGRLGKEAF